MIRLARLFGVVMLSWCTVPVIGDEPADESDAIEVFESRIMPIFRSPKPSSCIQCHLASVDLKQYILPSHEKTFVALRDQGLIDLETPKQSKILKLIKMGEKDFDKSAQRLHEKTREAEYKAFAAWITACCRDPGLRDLPRLPATDNAAGPQKPEQVIRHTRKSRVLDSFIRNIWSQRMRCFPCHVPHEIDQNNPHHRKAEAKYEEFKAKYGAKIHIFRETPEATMKYLIRQTRSSGDRLPVINLEDPPKSLLVKKPTSKLPAKADNGMFDKPSSAEPVTHMGGLKMHKDDQSYKAFIAWIQDYARVVRGEYNVPADLPNDDWYPTRQVLRVKQAPDRWALLTPVQLFVYSRDESKSAWQQQPVAFTQGIVTPRRMVNGFLFLMAGDDPRRRESWQRHVTKLPPGEYLIKAYLDTQQRLAEDPTILLGEEDYYGQTEMRAHWKEGFKHAEVVDGGQFRE